MLSKKDFAQKVAEIVGGEVREVEKANGVILTGITVPTGSSNVSATIYVRKMIEDGLTPEEAAEQVKMVMEREQETQINVDFMKDFEQVKPLLRARLYNEKTNADIYRSADIYGFNDLIIVPYISFSMGSTNGAIKVTNDHIKMWNTTPEEVLQVAESNSNNDACLMSMRDIMISMGAPAEYVPEDSGMYVISNSFKTFGAYAIIPKLDELRQIFPDGFAILPSSVHEVIAVPIVEADLDGMVSGVNAEMVADEETLSDHAYIIAA